MTRQGSAAPGTKRALLALAGALLALAAMPALAAAHHRDIRVSGTYAAYDFGTTQCAPKRASPDILACSTTGFRSTYAGSLVGDVSTEFTNTINCKTGRTWGHGVETFTGSLNGSATGTLTWKISFRSDFDCTTSLPSGFLGHSHIKASSGALAGVHGRLQFGDVTYDGLLR
jgi:hypothetical protein